MIPFQVHDTGTVEYHLNKVRSYLQADTVPRRQSSWESGLIDASGKGTALWRRMINFTFTSLLETLS